VNVVTEDAAIAVTPFANGTAWVRADFHLHTKADKEFKYDGADNAFAEAYVERLKAANIGLGVITNHNKFNADEFKALRKRARKASIALLPGVELSVNDGANAHAKGKSDAFKELLLKSLADLLSYQVPNSYEVTYHRKPLKSHSLGQRASAMMLFLLSQDDNDLLLIDQPEDDLDSRNASGSGTVACGLGASWKSSPISAGRLAASTREQSSALNPL
jgi:hypothetical protein